ncbi:MAG: hypothetical protein WB795_21530 [Candidatus Acidiferrales bacterium]
MKSAFEMWVGLPIVLRVAAGSLRVPLRGTLVAETTEVVRIRIADSWEVDIFKSMITGVEQDAPVLTVQ